MEWINQTPDAEKHYLPKESVFTTVAREVHLVSINEDSKSLLKRLGFYCQLGVETAI